MVLSLNMVKLVDEPLVVHSNILYITEDLLEELGEALPVDDRRVNFLQWGDKDLTEVRAVFVGALMLGFTLLILCKSFTYSISVAMSSKIILGED